MTTFAELKEMSREERKEKLKDMSITLAKNIAFGVVVAVSVHAISKPINTAIDQKFEPKELEATESDSEE